MAAHTLCRAACDVRPAVIAALALAGGDLTSSVGNPERMAKSRCSSAVPASGRTSAVLPIDSRSLDICETATGEENSTESIRVSIPSSAGATGAAAAGVADERGIAAIAGSTKLTHPSSALPMASSTALRPSGPIAAAFAGSSGPPGWTQPSTAVTDPAIAAAAAAGSSAVHSLVTSMSRALNPIQASRSSSRVSYSSSHSSPLHSGAPAVERPDASPPPRCSHVLAHSSSAATAPPGSENPFDPIAAPPDAPFSTPPAVRTADPPRCWAWAPHTPDPIALSGLTNVPGSSAPIALSSPGHAGIAAARTSSLGCLVSPRSASRNAARKPSSLMTWTWFAATVATVSVSLRAYSASSDPTPAGAAASTRCAAMPNPRHIPSRPTTTAAASAAASRAASSASAAANAAGSLLDVPFLPPATPAAPLAMALLTVSPLRRCATCRSTSHACARNDMSAPEDNSWQQASRTPLRIRGARGAHSPYTAAALRAAETAAACALATGVFPPAAAFIAAEK
mmetsp:Transcript_14340/g.58403  ORF Transcript_14340/g.58403 Transcript_14340/m.58403 type:complete len:512 (-) Transcript_14340:834-2369(-)